MKAVNVTERPKFCMHTTERVIVTAFDHVFGHRYTQQFDFGSDRVATAAVFGACQRVSVRDTLRRSK
jgi:hypothetical protein